MRSDMAKVIVERPRLGANRHSAPGYRKTLQGTPPEELPKRESIYRYRGKTKHFNEHLGPLRRFLRARVGRPWDQVYSEICRNLRQDSAIQSHVRDHVWDYVALQVEERDGVIYRATGWRGFRLRSGQLYVCPQTGILKSATEPAKSVPDVVPGRRNLEYRRLRGDWYELRLREVPADGDERAACFDAWLGRAVSKVSERELRGLYPVSTKKPARYAQSARKVSSAEARELSQRASLLASRSR